MTNGHFEKMLSEGSKANSLGRVNDVVDEVLGDMVLLEELYGCMFSQDAWVRMRAADAFEKVCRQHPKWIEPYIDRIQAALSGAEQQPSIKWHLAQIYQQVALTDTQKLHALSWLVDLLSTSEADWIVAANAMEALAYFTKKGDFPSTRLADLLDIQLNHRSNAVVKKAKKLMTTAGI
jgi:hypothetical protein